MIKLEVKAALSVDEAGLITGIAWPFGSADRVGDVIEKGAFATAVAPLPMLFGHDRNQPIGVWNEVSETAEGLQVKGTLLVDDVPKAREARALVRSGALRGLSIGFITTKVECSIVAVPSHPGARVTTAKSAETAFALAEAINRATTALRGQ